MLKRILNKYDKKNCDCIEEIQFWSHGSPGNSMNIDKTGDEITANDFKIPGLSRYGGRLGLYDRYPGSPKYRAYKAWYSSLSKRQQLFVRLREMICGPGAEIYYRSCEAFQGKKGKKFAEKSGKFWRSKVIGHTHIIGIKQPGKKVLKPGQKPYWSETEGVGGKVKAP